MNSVNNEKDMRKIEELTATNRLLTDLTEAGSWTINFASDGSVASVQWGDGLRRLLGYTDLHDFPNELESFMFIRKIGIRLLVASVPVFMMKTS